MIFFSTNAFASSEIDLDDPRGQESLVDTTKYGLNGASLYGRKDGFNAPYNQIFKHGLEKIYLREGLTKILSNLNEAIKQQGVELFLIDGFRPIEMQQELWDFVYENEKKKNPKATDDELSAFTLQYISDPRDFNPSKPITWPVHSCGGAIDLTLRIIDTKEPVFMGSLLDDPSNISHTRFFEEKYEQKANEWTPSDQNALEWRRVLYHLMIRNNLINYPHEWWHFSYGDQLWAYGQKRFLGKNVKRFYGTTRLP